MSSNTPNLDLLKKDPATDGLDTFNIQTMLNDNWDKIDATTGPASATTKGVVKIGSGINVDGAGVISVSTVAAPVSSVNSKTGVVVLAPSDIGAATSSQGAKADSALQTSQLGAIGGVAKQDDLTTHSAGNASETVKGHVELATAVETTTGTDNTRAVHPAGLKVELDKKITHSLATALSDFLVASGPGVFVKKTLADVKVILGLGTAAYTASTTYATAAQGLLATNAIPLSQKGATGGVALFDDVTIHLAENASETVKGHVQLSSSTASTSTTLAATPSAVKTAMDKANAAIPTSQKGVANGVASLGANGKISESLFSYYSPSSTIISSQLPELTATSAYVVFATFYAPNDGSFRITGELYTTSATGTSYVVATDGWDHAISSEFTTTSLTYISFSVDTSRVPIGTPIKIKFKRGNIGTAYIRNVYFRGSI